MTDKEKLNEIRKVAGLDYLIGGTKVEEYWDWLVKQVELMQSHAPEGRNYTNAQYIELLQENERVKEHWIDENRKLFMELQSAKEEIKRIKIGSDIFSKGNAHCEVCHYDTGWLGMNDLIFKLSVEGGYLISDKEGGYFSRCPKCESDNLSLES